MHAAQRTTAEAARTQEEVLLQPLPAGIQEVNLRDSRTDVAVLWPQPTTVAGETLAQAASC